MFFQVQHNNGVAPPRVTVFGDYHALDVVSRKNALAIQELAHRLPCHGEIDLVRRRPGRVGSIVTGPGGLLRVRAGVRLALPRPLARTTWSWTGSRRSTCLLETGNLLIHPRCVRLKAAFQTYCRQRRGGQWIDFPADGHPEEDLIDALRGGVRDAFPEGLVPKPDFRPVHASRVVGF